jgi:hypothetical protein
MPIEPRSGLPSNRPNSIRKSERIARNNTELALQLQLIEGSESMGDHDSGSDDWWCVG